MVCGKVQQQGVTEKYQIREDPRAEKLLTSARFLQDDVYTRICDLSTAKNILSADLFYHNQCINKYICKYNTQSATPAVEEQEKCFKHSCYYFSYVNHNINKENLPPKRCWKDYRGITVSEELYLQETVNEVYVNLRN